MRSIVLTIALSFCGLLTVGADRAMAAELKLEVKLMKYTAVPKRTDIDTYSRALSLYEYEVLKVTKGNYTKKTITVAKWSIWQKLVMSGLPQRVGSVEILDLDRLSSHAKFDHDRILGKASDESTVIYYDLSSEPSSGKQAKGEQLDRWQGELAVQGLNRDWLFLRSEKQHMQAGEYWKSWTLQSEEINPLQVVLDFQKRLKQQGIELIVVPVPAKSAIYSDYVSGVKPTAKSVGLRELLTREGVKVLDLESEFLKLRKGSSRRELYCPKDSHWSPEGCRVTAELLAEVIKKKPWFAEANKQSFEAGMTSLLEMTGDLSLDHNKVKDTISIEYVSGIDDRVVADTQPDSPIILLGDSHTLVFSDKQRFFADGAGLSDHLAVTTGIPVDVVASLGSGLQGARASLYRNRAGNKKFPDYLKSKKLVIWCFAEREFSQAKSLSCKIPLVSRKR